MKNEDIDLIQHVLSGDEGAFATLVGRHREWVHSLAWREIGDFHIAQEITQDTFIQAFKSLPDLRDHNRFSGWLYVIAKRQCIEWLRKKPAVMESLDSMPRADLEQLFYAQYLEEEQAKATTNELREVVEHLLQKLPATERSVIVLHYFKGLTCEEVSAFLDVSLNTIKSRLHRARKRLEREEFMIRETLSPSLLKSHPRCVSIQSTAVTETDEHLAEGNFNLIQTDKALTSSGFGTQGWGGGDPSPMYMLLHYLYHGGIDLFRFPVVGNSWERKGSWKSQVATTVEGYEAVDVSAGTFSDCLKHKTVITGAEIEDTNPELRMALANGTRYLWFAKGIGFVKMRYEHSNGVATEAELIKYEVPLQNEEYFPIQIGTQWTYKWQNTYRDEAVIEEWQVIRNFRQPRHLDDPMKLTSARYEVKIDADERRVANVKCVLTPKVDSGEKADQKSLLLSMTHFGTEWLYDGYARYLQDLTATDAKGEALVVEEIDKTQWLVETREASPVTLHYKVLLDHDERDWPFGKSEAPYLQEDCIFLPGYALFITGEVDNIELCVDVPDNWHVSTPWQRIGNDGHRFECVDQDDLMYAYLMIGEHRERLARSEDVEIVLTTGGRFKGAMDEIQPAIEAILQAYSGIFDGTPKGRMLFVANPYGEEGYRDGGASRRSISVLMGNVLDETSRNFWAPLVARMICYIWNGISIDFRDQEYWFSAGFTQYYSKVVCSRLGLVSEDDFVKDLERTWESYLSRQGRKSIREAGEDKSSNRELVYDGGSLVAAALDLQIRKYTQNRKSLDDVMKRMYQEFGLTDAAYTMDDVIRIVSQVTGGDFEPFFSRYVDGTEELPLDRYLRNAGVDARIEFGEKLPNLGYVLHEMLHTSEIGGPPGEGLFIRRSPLYQNDDNLVGIDGVPVKTFDDIRRIAKDWRSGDVVELTLERDSATIIMPVILGGTSEKPPMEADVIDVTITKRADSTDSERAIWSGILGGGR